MPRPLEDTHDRIDNIQLQLRSVHARMDGLESNLTEIVKELKANTEVTKEVRDFFTTARVSKKVIVGTGSIVVAFAAIGAAWKYLVNHSF